MDIKDDRFRFSVRAQLERILASADFARSPSMSEVLRFIIEEWLAGRGDQIKGYTIAVKALHRPADFDPQTDTIVRVQVGKLRQRLEHYYLTEGIQDSILITIPTGAYLPTVSARGEAPALEETAEPAAASDEAGGSELPTQASIAVIELENMTRQDEYAYFATGLTEELIITLAQDPTLLVLGPLSRARLQAESLGPRRIGQKYGTRFIIDGSIGWMRNWLRARVKVVDTKTGVILWSGSYDRLFEAETLLALEESIGRNVAATVGGAVIGINRYVFRGSWLRPEVSLAAQQAILRWHHYRYWSSLENWYEAVQAIEKVLEEDDSFGVAWSSLAELYLDYPDLDLTVSPYQSLAKAVGFLNRAIELDPDNLLTQMARVRVSYHTRQLDELQEAVEILLQSKLTPYLLGELGCTLALAGDYERGVRLIRQAQAQHPHHPGYYHAPIIMHYYYNGEYGAALAELEKYQGSVHFWTPFLQAAIYAQLERETEAKQALQRLLEMVPDFALRGRELIRFGLAWDACAEMLEQGLRKAGLVLEG